MSALSTTKHNMEETDVGENMGFFLLLVFFCKLPSLLTLKLIDILFHKCLTNNIAQVWVCLLV